MHSASRLINIKKYILLLVILGLCGACTEDFSQSRLEQVKKRGFLTCGIWPGIAGFATVDAHGQHHGIDIEVCRAMSAAIFGNPDNVRYVRAKNVEQLYYDKALDIISRRITWSLTRGLENRLIFGPVIFYDGQGFLVPKRLGIESIAQIEGSSVCVQSIESHAATLASYALTNNLNITNVPVDNNEDVKFSFETGRCIAYSADVSLLGAAKLELGENPEDFIILPIMISKEPLAPLVRMGDDQFFEILRWTIFAMIAAEEFGITSNNIDSQLENKTLEIRQLLGVMPGNGAALGLNENWAYEVIKDIGNYGEMFDRNVGSDSAIKLERGMNKSWDEGGLMFAPRLR